MKRTPKTTSFAARAFACLAFVALIPAGFASANGVATVPPPNLATAAAGAQVECTMPDGRVVPVASATAANKNAIALLTGDEQLSCPLQEGQTTFVIKLPETTPLDRFTFVNENAAAAGEMKISVSNFQLPAASPKWTEVAGNIAFSHKRLFNVSIVGVEARYLRLAFNVAKGDRFASLGVSRPRTAAGNYHLGWMSSAQAEKRPRKQDHGIDYAARRAKGRIVFVSSNADGERESMIDHNDETSFRFASDDQRPTAIVELGENERINRVTARYNMPRAGRLDVYLLDDLGKSATDINYRQPIASTSEQSEDGEAAVEFDPQGARYVAVRFTPNNSAEEDAFEITEIHAYGPKSVALINALEAPDVYVSNQSGTNFPGEITQDVSSSLGTLAVPPMIPEVSP